jgi:hypothetical protein
MKGVEVEALSLNIASLDSEGTGPASVGQISLCKVRVKCIRTKIKLPFFAVRPLRNIFVPDGLLSSSFFTKSSICAGCRGEV